MNEEPSQEESTTSPQPEDQQPPTPSETPSPAAPVFTQPAPTDSELRGPKKNKKLPIIISSIVGALLIAAVVLFFIFVFPRLQAEGTASSFMTAIKNDDNAKMTELSGEGGDSITTRVHDGLKDASYKLASTDQSKDGFNVHFNITNSSVLNSVTIVVEKNKVTNVVITSKTTSASEADSTSADSVATTTPTTCLTAEDLATLGYTSFDNPSTTHQTLDSFYFQPDSTEYASGYFNDVITPAKIYKTFSAKAFNYTLRGQVNEAASTSGGVEIANNRATKVKNELVAAGVPAGRISFEEPEFSSSSDFDPIIFRTVTLFVTAPADCKITGA